MFTSWKSLTVLFLFLSISAVLTISLGFFGLFLVVCALLGLFSK